jgi:DNA-binding MarR family transcriptional regulator
MDNSEHLEKFFLNRKPVQLLIHLKGPGNDNYASALASKADVTYSHTVKCLQKMEEHGLVEFEKKGRKKEVSLTEYGEKVSTHFDDVVATFSEKEMHIGS